MLTKYFEEIDGTFDMNNGFQFNDVTQKELNKTKSNCDPFWMKCKKAFYSMLVYYAAETKGEDFLLKDDIIPFMLKTMNLCRYNRHEESFDNSEFSKIMANHVEEMKKNNKESKAYEHFLIFSLAPNFTMSSLTITEIVNITAFIAEHNLM